MPTMYGLARLGRDAEVRYTAAGDAVCSLSLAFNFRKGKDKMTQWVDGELWGKRAESLAPYLLKGGAVVATLEDVHIETFEDRSGKPGQKLKGRVANIELAGGSDNKEQAPAPEKSAPLAKARPPAAAPSPAPSKAAGFDDMDDDIPF